jgi:hypothetical protein
MASKAIQNLPSCSGLVDAISEFVDYIVNSETAPNTMATNTSFNEAHISLRSTPRDTLFIKDCNLVRYATVAAPDACPLREKDKSRYNMIALGCDIPLPFGTGHTLAGFCPAPSCP